VRDQTTDGFMMLICDEIVVFIPSSQFTVVEKNCRIVPCERKVVCKNRKLLLIV